jgi:hypothetical protein
VGHEIGQMSFAQPAVLFDAKSKNKLFHMLFMASDGSNALLYATSTDGENWNFVGQVAGESTSAAPGIALYQIPKGGTLDPNLLVAVYMSNDASGRILYSILDLKRDPNRGDWVFKGQVAGESSGAGPYPLGTDRLAGSPRPSDLVIVYFVAHNASTFFGARRLLWAEFDPTV